MGFFRNRLKEERYGFTQRNDDGKWGGGEGNSTPIFDSGTRSITLTGNKALTPIYTPTKKCIGYFEIISAEGLNTSAYYTAMRLYGHAVERSMIGLHNTSGQLLITNYTTTASGAGLGSNIGKKTVAGTGGEWNIADAEYPFSLFAVGSTFTTSNVITVTYRLRVFELPEV